MTFIPIGATHQTNITIHTVATSIDCNEQRTLTKLKKIQHNPLRASNTCYYFVVVVYNYTFLFISF